MDCVNIVIIDDNDYELVHTFSVDIMTIEPPNSVMDTAGTANVQITDNDGKLLLFIFYSIILSPFVYSSNCLINKQYVYWC